MKLERKICSQIRKWYESDQKKALLIKGARQVGKTHSIRTTLEELCSDFIEINLIETPAAIGILENFSNINELIMGLSTIADKPIRKGKTIFFIDEVQKYKEMVTKIKFLVEDGSFRYVLSGSLLGVEITSLQSAPVGFLSSFEMFPLDFEEFLQISKISVEIKEHLHDCFVNRSPVSEPIHQKLILLFYQYLVVGGMPEAVSRFAETYDVDDVVNIHRNIIELYKLDFTQYEADNKRLILSNIYEMIPSELLKQNRRFIVSDIKKGLHYERVESSFLWLYKAGVVLPVFNATEPRIPLKLNEKQSLFKLYLSDVGMLTSIYGMNTKARLLGRDRSLNNGGIYENAVACELFSKGLSVYYCNSKRHGELDFVVEYEGNLTPIEVKSGRDYTVHRALDYCVNNEEYAVREGFVFADCNIETRGRITYLPIYMAGFLRRERESRMIVEKIQF